MTTSQDQIQLAVIKTDISYIKDTVKDIQLKLEQNYVTKSELEPIRRIVYGTVGILLAGLVSGLLALLLGWKP